jgi:hypothetical protein
MSQSRKDEQAEAVTKSTIARLFGANAVDRVDVFPTEDQAGEEGLSVTVFLKAAHENVSGVRLLDTIAAVSEALRTIDDFRFPYVTFLGPGYEHAEDDARPAA